MAKDKMKATKVAKFKGKEVVEREIMRIDFDIPMYDSSEEKSLHAEPFTAFFNARDMPVHTAEHLMDHLLDDISADDEFNYNFDPKLFVLAREDADALIEILNSGKDIQKLCRVDFEDQDAELPEPMQFSALYHPDIISTDKMHLIFAEMNEPDSLKEVITLSREKDHPWWSLQRFNMIFGFIPKRTNSNLYLLKTGE